MADYYFRARGLGKRGRFMMELSFWMGAFFFIFFSYLFWKNPTQFQALTKMYWFTPASLIFFYILVVSPFRRVLRLQLYASVVIETTRKGFHFKDSARDVTLAWRDLTDARVRLDVHHFLGVYVREVYLRYSKGTIVLKPDPVTNPMEGVFDFVEELKARVPGVKTTLTWFYPFCPYCREGLEPGKTCACGENVTFVHKLSRPWELFRDEMLLFILLGLFNIQLMPVMIGLVVLASALPLITVRREKIKLFPEAKKAEEERIAYLRRQAEEKAQKKSGKSEPPPKAEPPSDVEPPRAEEPVEGGSDGESSREPVGAGDPIKS